MGQCHFLNGVLQCQDGGLTIMRIGQLGSLGLDHATEFANVRNVVLAGLEHIAAPLGADDHQAQQLQLVEGLAYRGPAHAKATGERFFGDHFSEFELAIDDRAPKPLRHSAGQRLGWGLESEVFDQVCAFSAIGIMRCLSRGSHIRVFT
jgi:hypothetical protein